MKYFSCFSGIEAASVAWKPLGWEAVGFSEIEPFPSAVLAHHFPNTKNYGDITKYNEWGIAPGSVDLVVGGSPCQAFSVAGLRQGLADPRGNLALVFLGLVDRLRPRWVIWENVPGVLSSNGGEDFAAFISALGQLGYGWSYRVLDAQFFGVPQRRRRVFLVASSTGDWRPCAEVLSLAEGLRGYIEESGKEGEVSATDVEKGVAKDGKPGPWWDGADTASTLTKKGAGGQQRMPDKGNFEAIIESKEINCQPDGISGAVSCKWSKGSGGPAGDEHYNMIAEQISHWDGGPHPTLNQSNKSNGSPGYSNQELFSQGGGGLVPCDNQVPYRKSKRAQSDKDYETWVEDEKANTINVFDSGDTRTTHAVVDNSQVPMMFKVRGGVDVNSGVQGGVVGKGAGKGFLGSEDKAFTVATAQDQWLAQPQHPIALDTYNQSTSNTNQAISSSATDVNHYGAVFTPPFMAVRRLTPIECERLQGFPDNWTLISWKGRPAEECPDGPRYKACGNSMAVPVMAWIGKQIANYEASQK